MTPNDFPPPPLDDLGRDPLEGDWPPRTWLEAEEPAAPPMPARPANPGPFPPPEWGYGPDGLPARADALPPLDMAAAPPLSTSHEGTPSFADGGPPPPDWGQAPQPTGGLLEEPSLVDSYRPPTIRRDGAPDMVPQEPSPHVDDTALGVPELQASRTARPTRNDLDIGLPSAPASDDALPPMSPAEGAEFMVNQGAEYVAAQGARREAERNQFEAEQKTRALEKDAEQAEVNLARLQRANVAAQEEHADLRREAKQLAEREIDPDRWWGSRSTGQKVAAYAAAIMGGLLSPHRGGRNDGLNLIFDAIDRDIAAQQADLENKSNLLGQRRGMLAEQYALSGDAYKAAEAVRLASLKRVDEMLAAAGQQYDQRGSIMQAIAEERLRVRGKIAQAEAAAGEVLWKRQQDRAKMELEADRQAEIKRNNRQQNALGWAAHKRAQRQQDLAERQFEADEQRQSQEAAAIDPALRATVGIDSQGNTVYAQARSEKDAQELTRLAAATKKIVRKVGNLIALREKHGHTSDTWNSAANNWMRQNEEMLKLDVAELYGVSYSKRTAHALKGLTGGDPTAVLDSTDYLKALADNAVADYQTQLRERTTYNGSNLPLASFSAAPEPDLYESFRTLDSDSGPMGWIHADERISAGRAVAGEAIRSPGHRRSAIFHLSTALENEQKRLAVDQAIRAETEDHSKKMQAINRIGERQKVIGFLESELEKLRSQEGESSDARSYIDAQRHTLP